MHTAWVDGDTRLRGGGRRLRQGPPPRPGGAEAPRRVDGRARAVGAGEHPRPEARPADDARRARRLPGVRDRHALARRPRQPPARSTGPTAASASSGCSPTSRPSTSTTRSCGSPPGRCGVRRDLPDVFVGEGTTYAGLRTTSEHALAFARGDADGPRVVTVVTRAAGLLAACRRLRRRHGRACRRDAGATCCPTTRGHDRRRGGAPRRPPGRPPGRAAREAVVTAGPRSDGVPPGAGQRRSRCGPRSPSTSRSSGPPSPHRPTGRPRHSPRRDAMTPSATAGGAGSRARTQAATRRHPTSRTASAPLVLDYAFVLDGEEPALPDPRSAWQPHGVHGPSRTFDPAAFAWTDGGWRGPRSGQACSAASSTSCTSAPSPPRAPSTRPSPGSTTSSRWASTSSS